MPLTCGNVELRGFEPLTFCIPCKSVRAGASFINGKLVERPSEKAQPEAA
jgi:hypothetical protein